MPPFRHGLSRGDTHGLPISQSMDIPFPDFDQCFALDRLGEIYGRIRNRHYDLYRGRAIIQTGSDHIRLEQFDRDQEKHLRAVQRKVAENRYTFSPFIEIEKDKPGSTKKRIISLASIRDTIVQTALYDYLYPRVDVLLTDSVFGYRKGRNAHAAIRRIVDEFARGKTFVFDADFSGFFDSVDHELLLGKFREIEMDDRTGVLFRRFLKTGRIPPDQVAARAEHEGQQTKWRPLPRLCGVPQGGVLSGLASNLYLAEFDEMVRGMGEGYIRYADDFIVCCSSSEQCHEVRATVEEAAADLKLKLNEEKTRTCVAAANGVDFLGFRITDKSVTIRSKNIARFKERIVAILRRHEPASSSQATLSRLVWKLSFKIRGPRQADIRKLTELGQVQHPHRRCWIGFFRVVTEERQIRALDRWVRRQIAVYMWAKHRVRIRFRDMRTAGLPSLIGIMHRARRKMKASSASAASTSLGRT